jgi:hypothetical protein
MAVLATGERAFHFWEMEEEEEVEAEVVAVPPLVVMDCWTVELPLGRTLVCAGEAGRKRVSRKLTWRP